MKSPAPHETLATPALWAGWCCSYCGSPLTPRGHGLYCAAEGRWFATDRGVHRLLTEERRREVRPSLELLERMRRVEGLEAAALAARRRRLEEGLRLCADSLGPGPWRILEVGAGDGWASTRLAAAGHLVAAVDLSLEALAGSAGEASAAGRPNPARAEADMGALPLEASHFDLVLAVDSLHHAPRLASTLVELRRVLRRSGVLLVLASPVYARRKDGEAAAARRMRRLGRRYRIELPREGLAGYLVKGELAAVFGGAGFRLGVHAGSVGPRQWWQELLAIATGRRRPARYPILIAQRDG